MDDASSALDSETEDLVYQLILRELSNAAIVSIAHRETWRNIIRFVGSLLQKSALPKRPLRARHVALTGFNTANPARNNNVSADAVITYI